MFNIFKQQFYFNALCFYPLDINFMCIIQLIPPPQYLSTANFDRNL